VALFASIKNYLLGCILIKTVGFWDQSDN